MSWISFIKIAHVIGTVLGVGGATFAEYFYQEAIKDGVVDETERRFLRKTYPVMRIGMIILILSGLAFFIYYRLTGNAAKIYNPRLWAKMAITLIIVANTLLMQAKKVPLWLATSLSLTSWYSALILGLWREAPNSFWMIMGYYLVSLIVVAGILEIIREARQRNPRKVPH